MLIALEEVEMGPLLFKVRFELLVLMSMVCIETKMAGDVKTGDFGGERSFAAGACTHWATMQSGPSSSRKNADGLRPCFRRHNSANKNYGSPWSVFGQESGLFIRQLNGNQ